MEQLEKEYVSEAKLKWKEITEMMPFEPEEVKLATFQGLLRPFIYWSESRQGKKPATPAASNADPWYSKYSELKPRADPGRISKIKSIPDLRWGEVVRDAKLHGYAYHRESGDFVRVDEEGATA